jgi:hypothetical protein
MIYDINTMPHTHGHKIPSTRMSTLFLAGFVGFIHTCSRLLVGKVAVLCRPDFGDLSGASGQLLGVLLTRETTTHLFA